MKKELSAFEVYIRNQMRKQKDQEDQEMLDHMLMDLKKKNEAEKQQQIDELTKKLEKVRK
jgi:hypothetical protein